MLFYILLSTHIRTILYVCYEQLYSMCPILSCPHTLPSPPPKMCCSCHQTSSHTVRCLSMPSCAHVCVFVLLMFLLLLTSIFSCCKYVSPCQAIYFSLASCPSRYARVFLPLSHYADLNNQFLSLIPSFPPLGLRK